VEYRCKLTVAVASRQVGCAIAEEGKQVVTVTVTAVGIVNKTFVYSLTNTI
jgi:hypothetical protein